MSPLVRTLSAALMLAVPLALMWVGRRYPQPAKPPQPAPGASGDGEWLLAPFQLVGGLAALCWVLVGLAAFLSPLAALAWLVAR